MEHFSNSDCWSSPSNLLQVWPKTGKPKSNFFFLSNLSSLSFPKWYQLVCPEPGGGRHASCLSSTKEKPLVKITPVLQLHLEGGSVSFCHSECRRKETTGILSAVWGIHSFSLGLFLGTSPSFLNHRNLLPPQRHSPKDTVLRKS